MVSWPRDGVQEQLQKMLDIYNSIQCRLLWEVGTSGTQDAVRSKCDCTSGRRAMPYRSETPFLPVEGGAQSEAIIWVPDDKAQA